MEGDIFTGSRDWNVDISKSRHSVPPPPCHTKPTERQRVIRDTCFEYLENTRSHSPGWAVWGMSSGKEHVRDSVYLCDQWGMLCARTNELPVQALQFVHLFRNTSDFSIIPFIKSILTTSDYLGRDSFIDENWLFMSQSWDTHWWIRGSGNMCSLGVPLQSGTTRRMSPPLFLTLWGNGPKPETLSSFMGRVEDERVLTGREHIWGSHMDLSQKQGNINGNPVIKRRSSIGSTGPDPLGPNKNIHIMCFPL